MKLLHAGESADYKWIKMVAHEDYIKSVCVDDWDDWPVMKLCRMRDMIGGRMCR